MNFLKVTYLRLLIIVNVVLCIKTCSCIIFTAVPNAFLNSEQFQLILLDLYMIITLLVSHV
jgi:hypothetical protein